MDRRNLIKGSLAFVAVAATVGLPKLASDETVVDFVKSNMDEALEEVRFEFNDDFGRNWLETNFSNYLEYLKVETGAIEDYKVVCDRTNNPPSVIDANQIALDVWIKPKRALDYVRINAIGPDKL